MDTPKLARWRVTVDPYFWTHPDCRWPVGVWTPPNWPVGLGFWTPPNWPVGGRLGAGGLPRPPAPSSARRPSRADGGRIGDGEAGVLAGWAVGWRAGHVKRAEF